jgi:hypothetical protein
LKKVGRNMKKFSPAKYSFVFFFFIGMSLTCLYIFTFKLDPEIKNTFCALGFIAFLYFLCGYTFNYITLLKDRIEVVNSWFYQRIECNFADIEKIEFLTPPQQCFFVRIRLANKKRKAFYSDLDFEQIQSLANALRSSGITVVDKMTLYRLSEH